MCRAAICVRVRRNAGHWMCGTTCVRAAGRCSASRAPPPNQLTALPRSRPPLRRRRSDNHLRPQIRWPPSSPSSASCPRRRVRRAQPLATIESTDPGLRTALAVEVVGTDRRAHARRRHRISPPGRLRPGTHLSDAGADGRSRRSGHLRRDGAASGAMRGSRTSGSPKRTAPSTSHRCRRKPATRSARCFRRLDTGSSRAHEYQRALQLNPKAAYALNNLCYGWLLDGDLDKGDCVVSSGR